MPERKTREQMIAEIKWYCEQLDMAYPEGFPTEMSDEDMQKWIETWGEFDPCPDVQFCKVKYVYFRLSSAKLIQSGRLRFSDIYYFEGGSLSYCLLALLWVPTVNI